MIEHIQLAAVSTVIVVVLAVTTGILLTRPGTRRVTPLIIGLANIGQAVPSIGLLVLFAITWDFGFWPAIVALVAYSFLSILRNTMVGLQQVDRSTIEAARGMGMTKTAVLFRIELPLAVPIILAGIRTALIINIGTATLAAFVDAGGLGTVDRPWYPSGTGFGADRRQRADRRSGPVNRLVGRRGRGNLASERSVAWTVDVLFTQDRKEDRCAKGIAKLAEATRDSSPFLSWSRWAAAVAGPRGR